MIRLYLPFFLALLFLVVPNESAGQYGNLTDLSEVMIHVEKLGSAAKKLGLDEMEIENHVLVLLRSKLPHLLVKDFIAPTVYIHVNVAETKAEGEVIGYYGSVSVGVIRNVTIIKTGKFRPAYLYYSTIGLTGRPSHTSEGVRDILVDILTHLAAVSYKDNPTK